MTIDKKLDLEYTKEEVTETDNYESNDHSIVTTPAKIKMTSAMKIELSSQDANRNKKIPSTNQSPFRSKNMIEKKKFNPFDSSVGEIKDVFSGTYQNQHLRGDIYVTSNAVCFRSTNFFSLESGRFVLPWRIIVDIFLIENHGIGITTATAINTNRNNNESGNSTNGNVNTNNVLFEFVKMDRPQLDVMKILTETRKSRLGINNIDEDLTTHSDRGIENRSIHSCNNHGHDHNDGVFPLRRSLSMPSQSWDSNDGTRHSHHPDSNDANNTKSNANTTVIGETDEGYLAACTIAALAQFNPLSLTHHHNITTEDLRRKDGNVLLHINEEQEKDITTNVNGNHHCNGTANSTTAADSTNEAATTRSNTPVLTNMKEAWDEIRDAHDPHFDQTPIENTLLPRISLDDFFQRFLADNAQHSIGSYQENKIGDSEIKTSPWVLIQGNDSNPNINDSDRDESSHEPATATTNLIEIVTTASQQTRLIKYIHPINAPMAPPNAQATKIQRLTKFGNYGLCLETETIVNDVPLADCFTVKDRLLVEAVEDNDNGEDSNDGNYNNNKNDISSAGSGITINVHFGVIFTKKTMFRRIIENTTKGEITQFHRGFVQYIRAALEDEKYKSLEKQKNERMHENQDDTKEPIHTSILSKFGLGFTLSSSTTAETLIIGLLIVLLLSQLYSSLQMQSMQRSILSVQNTLETQILEGKMQLEELSSHMKVFCERFDAKHDEGGWDDM